MPEVIVHHGDSREVLKTLADNSVDSVVTDPPYALVSIGKRFGKPGAAPAKGNDAYTRASAGFMGQAWDTGETAFAVEFWAEVFRVLKPGGHVLAFAGTRTYHRLACAVEDAGFEIRDMVAWLYGSGFPKSHDVSKGIDKAAGAERPVVGRRVYGDGHIQNSVETIGYGGCDPAADQRVITAAATAEAAEWEGWGTALKPALEPVVLARKPLVGTVAANVLTHGTGALNIDASRVVVDAAEVVEASGEALCGAHEGYQRAGRSMFTHKPAVRGGPSNTAGRWPANVMHDGSDEVVGAFPAELKSGAPGIKRGGNEGAAYGAESRPPGTQMGGYGDSGAAARFFYSAKADAEDRMGSAHPTVKPVDLMRYMIALVTPPGGVVLDPFAGSGSTGVAAYVAGFSAILIEREARFVEDINRRLAWARGDGGHTATEKARAKLTKPENRSKARGADLPLFLDDDVI